MRRKHPWRDFNGPGKPITEQQLQEILKKEFGIMPDADGCYNWKDFEAAQAFYLDGKEN